MDLIQVTEVMTPLRRQEIPRGETDFAVLAGGTYLYSRPDLHHRRLLDITGMNWPALTVTDDGLEIAATCTVHELRTAETPRDWPAASLFGHCADALVASWKVQRVATIGGNIALSLPAGALTAAIVALDGRLIIWSPSGARRVQPVSEFVTGNGRNTLQPGEIIRSIVVDAAAMRSKIAVRRIAYSRHSRSGSLVIAVRGAAHHSLTVTAATTRPHVARFDRPPTTDDICKFVMSVADNEWLDDPHGTPAWRKHVTELLATDAVKELCT